MTTWVANSNQVNRRQALLLLLLLFIACIGLMWQDFVCGLGGLQDWLLWEESRSCHMLGKNQFQLAAKGTHCWPRLSQWATLVAPLLKVYIYETKKILHNSSWEREVRKCRKNPADTKISEEGASGARTEVSLQPVEGTMVEQAVPCSLWCTMAEQISMPQAPGEPVLE